MEILNTNLLSDKLGIVKSQPNTATAIYYNIKVQQHGKVDLSKSYSYRDYTYNLTLPTYSYDLEYCLVCASLLEIVIH